MENTASQEAPAGHIVGACQCSHPVCVAADIAYNVRVERAIEASEDV